MRTIAIVLGAALLLPAAAAQTTDPSKLFNEGMNALTGTEPGRDVFRGIDSLRRSAEQGYAPAQTALGYFWETGKYVALNQSEAATWYRKAAEQGDPIAMWVLGRMYFTGAGVPSNPAKAEDWLHRSAEQGNPFGAYLLGLLRETRDYRSAPEWFRKAAEQGLPYAQQKLGVLLKDGRAVALNKYQAYVWLLLSYESGLKSSAPYVSELEGQLSSADVERAKSEVRDLHARYSRGVVAGGCTGWPGELDELPTTPPPQIQRLCR